MYIEVFTKDTRYYFFSFLTRWSDLVYHLCNLGYLRGRKWMRMGESEEVDRTSPPDGSA